MTRKEWRAPFLNDAVLVKKTQGTCINILEGELINPEEYSRKYIAISEKEASWLCLYLKQCARDYGLVADTGKLSKSNLTIDYIEKKLGNDLKAFSQIVINTLNINNWVKLDYYRGAHKFYFVAVFVDEEKGLYMKVSLSPKGKLWVDLHPRGWRA